MTGEYWFQDDHATIHWEKETLKKKKKMFKHVVASNEQPTPFADGWPVEAAWQVCEKAVRDAHPETLEECWMVFADAFQTKCDADYRVVPGKNTPFL